MTDAFISYAREEKGFVHSLFVALKGKNRDAWVDWEDILPTSEWMIDIFKGIESAENFVFIISSASLASNICSKELNHAIECNKRLIPIVRQDVREEEVPGKLRELNWLFFRDIDNFDSSFESLLVALDTDMDWVKEHTRLLVRAIEWSENEQNRSYLLRGEDLELAEKWLGSSADKEPKSTGLQIDYILASRQDATRRQRRTIAISIGVATILAIAALFALFQANLAQTNERKRATAQASAEEQASIAQNKEQLRATAQAVAEERASVALSRQLSFGSKVYQEEHYDLSLIMAVESYKIMDTTEARNALFESLEHIPQLSKFVTHGSVRDNSFYSDLGLDLVLDYSPDGRYLAIREASPIIHIVDMESSEFVVSDLVGHGENVSALVFDSIGSNLHSIDEEGTIITWDLTNLQPKKIRQIELADDLGTSDEFAFSPDGRLVATTNFEEIQIWNLEGGVLESTIDTLPTHGMAPDGIIFSNDSQYLASGSFYTAAVWDLETGREVPNSRIETARPVSSLAFSPDNRLYAAGTEDGAVYIADLETSEIMDYPKEGQAYVFTGRNATTDINGHWDIVTALAFSPDSSLLLSGSYDQTIILWGTSDHWPKWGPIDVHHAPISGVAFGPNDDHVASVDTNGSAIIWDISKSDRLLEYVDEADFDFPTVAGVDLSSSECNELVNVSDSVCVLSPNGEIVVSYLLNELFGAYANDRWRDVVITIWHAASQQMIGEFLVPAFEPDQVQFGPDSKDVCLRGSSYQDAAICIELDVDTWIDIACEVANRNFSQGEWSRTMADLPYRSTCFQNSRLSSNTPSAPSVEEIATKALPPPTEEIAPKSTHTKIPTAVPTPTRSQQWGFQDNCIYSPMWTTFPDELFSTDNRGCILTSNLGFDAQNQNLLIGVQNPTTDKRFGIYSPTDGDVLIEFDIRIDQLETGASNELVSLGFGIISLNPFDTETEGFLYYVIESPQTGYPVFLKKKERGGSEQYVEIDGDYSRYALGTSQKLSFLIEGNQLTISVDEEIIRETTLASEERGFFIGYKFENAGGLIAQISNLSIQER